MADQTRLNDWLGVPTVGSAVTEHLAREIIRGRWPAGHRLREAEVAEALGVSRGPIREALRSLAEQGFVTLRPRLGAVVSGVSSKAIVQIYELRAMLESWATRLAVPQVRPADIEQFRHRMRQMAEHLAAEDYRRFYELGWALRDELYAHCPNEILVEEIKSLRTRLYSMPNMTWESKEHAQSYHRAYERVLDAIEARDEATAASVIEGFMREAGDQVAAYFRAMGERQEGAP